MYVGWLPVKRRGERDDKRWIEDGTASLHGGYTTMYVCKLVNGKV